MKDNLLTWKEAYMGDEFRELDFLDEVFLTKDIDVKDKGIDDFVTADTLKMKNITQRPQVT